MYTRSLPSIFANIIQSGFWEKHQGRRDLTWFVPLDLTFKLLHLDVSSSLKTLLLSLLSQPRALSTHKGFEILSLDTPFQRDVLT